MQMYAATAQISDSKVFPDENLRTFTQKLSIKYRKTMREALVLYISVVTSCKFSKTVFHINTITQCFSSLLQQKSKFFKSCTYNTTTICLEKSLVCNLGVCAHFIGIQVPVWDFQVLKKIVNGHMTRLVHYFFFPLIYQQHNKGSYIASKFLQHCRLN